MLNFLQRWRYETYFGGEQQIDLPLTMTKEEVSGKLDDLHMRGNWKSGSLKKGKRVKEKNAHGR